MVSLQCVRFACNMVNPTFSTSFWNEEVGSFDGWEAVIHRLKAGRGVIKQYVEYLKQR